MKTTLIDSDSDILMFKNGADEYVIHSNHGMGTFKSARETLSALRLLKGLGVKVSLSSIASIQEEIDNERIGF